MDQCTRFAIKWKLSIYVEVRREFNCVVCDIDIYREAFRVSLDSTISKGPSLADPHKPDI